MTVRISSAQAVELPIGVPLTTVTETGIWIWPQGVGVGPAIVMDDKDWVRLRESVDLARASFKGMQDYVACEGNGDAL